MPGSVFDRTPEQNAIVDGWAPPEVDVSRAHSARMYDYYLGGKTNFAADRAGAEQALEAFPHLRVGARENRAFLLRLVRHLAELGVDQFLDIGTGIPVEGRNTHDAAQAVTPATHVVYVDNDPIVLAHARALLTSNPAGATAYIDADVRDPDSILGHPKLAETLDLDRPLALLLVSVLPFVPGKATEVLARLTEPLAPGSYLGLSHMTADFDPEGVERLIDTYRQSGIHTQALSAEGVAELLPDGWEIAEPGVQNLPQWLPEPDAVLPDPVQVPAYGMLARKR